MAEYCCPHEFEEMEPMKKMFIGNIPKEATDEEVKELFSDFEIAEFTVVRKENNPKIFGFVTFTQCDDVDECLKKRPFKVKGRELQVKRAVPKDDQSDTAHYKTKKIFFANVTPDTTEEMVREYLEKRHPPQFGKIEELTLVKKRDGKPDEHKGYGFILCENEDMADRIAIGDRKCKIDPNSNKEQEFKKARPKEQGAGFGGRGGRGGGFVQRGGRGGKPAGYGAQGGYGGGYAQGGYGGGWGAQAGAYGGAYGGWGGYGGSPYGW